MTLRHVITFLGLVSFLLSGCSKQSAPPSTESSDRPILKIALSADGKLTVDGWDATLESLQASLHTLSEQHGAVCYYREAGQQGPPPIAMEVMKAIVASGLPLRISSRPDYSDSVGFDGKPATGEAVFAVADVALFPGEHWLEMRNEFYACVRNICLPVFKGVGEFKGVTIEVMADPTDFSSAEDRAAGLRKVYAADSAIVSGSLKEDNFTTDAGLTGVHFTFVERRVSNGKEVKSRNSIYLVQNTRGLCVSLIVHATGVSHESADLTAIDQMIRKTLRHSSRTYFSSSLGPKPALVHIPDSDPEMAAAIAQAQATLPQFWQVFKTREHGESDFLLVIRITDQGRTERFVLTEFEHRDGKTFGTIRSEPKIVTTVKRGDRIEIPATDITDWRYVRDGKEVGLRTAKILLKRLPAEQVQAVKKL